MNMIVPACLAAGLLLGAAPLGSQARADGLPINPGLWEIKTQNPMMGNEQVQQHCMKEAEFDPVSMMGEKQGCEIMNQQIAGNTVDYDLTCTDDTEQGKAEGHFTFTIDGDQGNGQVDLKMSFGEQSMNMQYTMDAQRVGDC
jgi:hypothetical protein